MSRNGEQRRLSAILAADVAGYTRLVEQDTEGTVTAWKSARDEVINPAVTERAGRIVKFTGDGFLAEFPSVEDAVGCAMEIQEELADSALAFRMGIHLGDVIDDGQDIHGEGVNIAARIEALAESNGISVSAAVYEQVRNRIDANFQNMGEHVVKHVSAPVRVFSIVNQFSRGVENVELVTEQISLEKPSISVSPFEYFSSDASNRYVAEGFAADLISELSKIDNLTVISHTSPDSASAADFIIEGSVRSAGVKLRANVQLIDCKTGQHIWAERFDGVLDDVFEFQDNVVERIVTALEVRLSDGEQVLLWRSEAGDPKVYALFLSARSAYKEYSRASNARARRGYENAVALSPRFVPALAGLARTHIEDASFGWSASRDASEREAKRLLDKALEIAPKHALAHTEMAHLLMVQGGFEDAYDEAARAVAIDPNLADAQHVLGIVLVCQSRPEEALKSCLRAIQLNPSTPEFYLITLSEAYIALSRHDDAIATLRHIEMRRPDWIMVHALMAIAQMSISQSRAAKAAVKKILDRYPTFTATKWRNRIFYPNRTDIPNLNSLLISSGLPEQ